MAITGAQVSIKYDSQGVPTVTTDLKQVGGALDQASQKSGGFWSNMASTAGGVLSANILGNLTSNLVDFGKTAFTTGLDFESQMSAVGAVTGATGTELKSLSDLALQIGKDTSFGATEAASAIEELAKAGVSTSNILDGAADATVALAAAGGVDLPSAATVMSAAMNQFGISGDQASRVADLLAAASAKSATGVLEMGESLKYVGTSANALGYPIEDVTTALAMMADQGMVGSMAGTSLNNMLLSLANPTAKAAEEMDRLGLSFKDAATGELKDFPTLIADVSAATEGMTDAQRAATLETLFGVEGGRAMNALLASQSEEAAAAGKTWGDYYEAITESGVAAEQAAARLDNTRGDIENLKGTLETISIMATMAFLPSLRGAIQGVTKVLEVIPEWIGNFEMLRGSFGILDAAAIGLQMAINTVFGEAIGDKVGKFVGMFFDGIGTIVEVVQTLAGIISGVLGTALGFLADHLGDVIGAVSGIAAAGAAFLAWGAVTAIVTGIGAALAALLSPIALIIGAAALIGIAWRRDWFGIQGIVGSVVGFITSAIGTLVGYLQSAFSGGFMSGLATIWDDIGNAVSGLVGKFAPLQDAIRLLSPAFDAVVGSVQRFVSYLQGAFSGGFASGISTLVADITRLGAKFPPLVKLVQALAGPFGQVRVAAVQFGSALKLIASGNYTGALNKLKSAITSLGKGFAGIISSLDEFVASLLSIARTGVDRLIDSLKSKFTAFSSTFDRLNGVIGGFLGVLSSLYSAMAALMAGDWSSAWDAFKDAFVGAVSTIGNLALTIPTLIIDAIRAIPWDGVWDGITDAWDAIDWGALASKARDLVIAGLKAAGGAASDMWSWLTDSLDGAFDSMKSSVITGLSLAWDALTSLNWGDFISNLAWDAFATVLEWGSYIGGKIADLGGWLADKVTDLPWGDWISGAVDLATTIAGKITELPWGDWISGAVDLATEVVAKITELPWGDWVSGAVDLTTKVVEKITELPWGDWVSGTVDLATKVVEKIVELPWGDWVSGTVDLATEVVAKITELPWSDWVSGTVDLATEVVAKITELPWGDWISGAVDLATEVVAKIAELPWSDWVSGTVDLATEVVAKITALPWSDWISGAVDLTTEVVAKITSLPWGDWVSGTVDLSKKVVEKITSLPWGDWVSGTVDLSTQVVKKIVALPWSNWVSGAVDLLTQIPAKITSLPWSDWVSGAVDLVEAITSKIPTIDWPDMPSASDVAGWIKDAIVGWVSSNQATEDGENGVSSDGSWADNLWEEQPENSAGGTRQGLAGNLNLGGLNGANISGGHGSSGGGIDLGLGTLTTQLAAAQAAVTGFVSTTIGVMGGWTTGISTMLTTIGTNLTTYGTNITTASTATISFVSTTIGVMGGWVGGITTMLTTIATAWTTYATNLVTASTATVAFVATTIGVLGGWVGGISTMLTTIGTAWTTYGTKLTTATAATTAFVGTTIGVLGGWTGGVGTMISTVGKHMTTYGTALSTATTKTTGFVSTTIGVLGGWVGGIGNMISTVSSAFTSRLASALSGGERDFRALASTASTAMSGVSRSVSSAMTTAGSAISSNASTWPGIISGIAGSMGANGYNAGAAAGFGVANGLNAALGSVTAAANAIAAQVDRAIAKRLQIASPSKVTTYLGKMVGEGLVSGIEGMVGDVGAASGLLGDAAVPTLADPYIGRYSAPSMTTAPQPTVQNVNTFLVISPEFLRDLPDTVNAVRVLTSDEDLRAILGED